MGLRGRGGGGGGGLGSPGFKSWKIAVATR